MGTDPHLSPHRLARPKSRLAVPVPELQVSWAPVCLGDLVVAVVFALFAGS